MMMVNMALEYSCKNVVGLNGSGLSFGRKTVLCTGGERVERAVPSSKASMQKKLILTTKVYQRN